MRDADGTVCIDRTNRTVTAPRDLQQLFKKAPKAGQLFETSASLSTFADHVDADLTLGGTQWNGIPTAVLQGYSPQFQRFWNVAYVDDRDGDGVWDAVRIAVIVRWGDPASGYRRIVAYTTKANPRPTP